MALNLPIMHVVAGLWIENGKVFIARRAPHDTGAGRWEFPGGKVELGEKPEAALKRELLEELNLDMEVLGFFDANRFKTERVEIHLELYRVNRLAGEIKLTDHSEYKWVLPEELHSYEMMTGDLPFIEKILKL